MTSDDRLVELIRLSMERTRQLTQAGREHAQAVGDLNSILSTASTRVENSVQQAETALEALHNRVHQLETELASAFDSASAALGQARTRQVESHSLHQAAQTEVDAALMRVLSASESAVSQLHVDLALATQNLSSATEVARISAAAVVERAEHLSGQVGNARQSLEESRLILEQQAQTSLAEYETMRLSLMAQVQRLQHEAKEARRRTQQEVDSMARSNRLAKDKVDRVVVNRFGVELAQQCSQISEQLGESIEGLKQVAVRPRRAADDDLLSMTRRIRETFPALEKIASVFRAAQQADMV